MHVERMKMLLTEGIDKLLTLPRVLGISNEQKAVLMAARYVILQDDTIAYKMLPFVSPYYQGLPPEEDGDGQPNSETPNT